MPKTRLTSKLLNDIEKYLRYTHSRLWDECFVKRSQSQRMKMDWGLVKIAVKAMKDYNKSHNPNDREQAMYAIDNFLRYDVEL